MEYKLRVADHFGIASSDLTISPKTMHSTVYAHNHNGVVVTDDQAARNQCKRINIPVTGTIGILKACALNTLVTIEEADDILRKMMLAGFYSPVKSMKDIILNP